MSPQNFQSSKTKTAAVVAVDLWFYSTEWFSRKSNLARIYFNHNSRVYGEGREVLTNVWTTDLDNIASKVLHTYSDFFFLPVIVTKNNSPWPCVHTLNCMPDEDFLWLVAETFTHK